MVARTSTVLAMRHPGCSQNKQTPQRSTEVRAAELYHNTKHITHIFSHTRHHQLLQPNPNPSNHPTKRRSEETQRVSTISLLLNIIRLSSPEPPSFEGGSRVPEHSTSFQIASRRLDRHLKHRPQRKARQHVVLELNREARGHKHQRTSDCHATASLRCARWRRRRCDR